MKLLAGQSDDSSLARLGAEAAKLIRDANYSELASRFGYALARGGDPATVIQSEVLACLSQRDGGVMELAAADPKITVKYFAPNDSSFFALVECTLALKQNAGGILAELMVTTIGNDKHVFLEQISYAA